jgi:hypothetical protein
MQNATYLTERYPGKETEFWTPCIYDFFCQYKPELAVSACIVAPSTGGPWYEAREQSRSLKIEGDILKEPGPEEFLLKIGTTFRLNLLDDPKRFPAKGDIAGITPDILVIRPHMQGVYVIENKPYYESRFDGNQGPDGRKSGVRLDY